MKLHKDHAQFTQLVKGVDGLLGHRELLNADTSMLLDTYISGLYEVYGLVFDLSVSVKKLEAFSKATKDNKKPLDYAAFIVETIDNEKSYVLLNYYVASFIQTVLKVIKPDCLEQVDNLLGELGVTPELLRNHITAYKNYQSSIKN